MLWFVIAYVVQTYLFIATINNNKIIILIIIMSKKTRQLFVTNGSVYEQKANRKVKLGALCENGNIKSFEVQFYAQFLAVQ